MDPNLLKTIAVAILTTVGLFAVLAKRRTIIIPKSNVLVLLVIGLTYTHYFAIDFSVSPENSAKLATWLLLTLTVSFFSSGFGPEVCLRKIFSLTEKASIILVLTSLVLAFSAAGYDEGSFVGFTDNPNIMGSYLSLIAAPSLLFSFKKRRTTLGKLVIAALICACLGLIFLTKSRAAFFSIVIAFFFVFIVTNKTSLTKKLLLSSLLFATPFALSNMIDKYDGTSIFFTRAYLFTLRFEAISQSPYWGWGYGADVNNTFDKFHIFPPSEKGNTILQAIEEFGIFVGGFFIIAFSFALKRATKKLSITIENPEISLFLVAATAHLMLETWLLNFQAILSLYFWTIFLFSIAIKTRPATHRTVSCA